MKHKSISLILTCILLSAAFPGCAKKQEPENPSETASSSSSEEGSKLQPFSPPVSFEAVTLEGDSITSDIFSESRLTMINVWATYCNPCLNEMPGLGELASDYAPEDFCLIGIISDVPEGSGQQELDQAKELVEATGADYTHLLLSESLYNSLLADVSAVPTTFFADKDGKILDIVIGAMEKDAWKEKIDALLEEL